MSSNHWLYRFSPQEDNLILDLQRARQAQEDSEGELRIHRYYKEIQAEESVLFWQSGEGAGIYALGKWTSSPYLPLEGPQRQRQIGYQITHLFQKPLLKEQLLKDSVLKDLAILKRPQSHIFKLASTEYEALNALFESHGCYKLEPLPPKTGLNSDQIHQACLKQGLMIEKSWVRRYKMSLDTSPLTILKGLSGVGKTWLTHAYAQAINAEYLLLPVSPQWMSSEELLGYYHPLKQSYIETPLSQFIQAALAQYQQAIKQGSPPQPFHVVFDEMNLARVEHYFAPFLSALEVRRREGMGSIPLVASEPLLIPPNLYFIGTINEDESTHPLPLKVLDRAQLLPLPLSKVFLEAKLSNKPYAEALLSLWVLLENDLPFGLRVIDEIATYIDLAQAEGIPWPTALDEEIVQKILSKLNLNTNPRLLPRLQAHLEGYPLSQAQLNTHLKGLAHVSDFFS